MYVHTYTHKSIRLVFLKLCLSSITHKITIGLIFKKPSRSKVIVSVKNQKLHD